MGFFNGGLFDFNRDGKMLPDEGFIGFMIFSELFREDEEERRRAETLDEDEDDEDDY